ncbi:prefoldin beta subunit [Fusarium phyllophilum]|uniref:Prefoldin beta subunit n=1 Tax=Fusarium phyllophilum TaxID=47803 RepID=A0A8H5I8S0_9HYPO|nr:prefoldin beta subunit [Fusarium phyllophilum]
MSDPQARLQALSEDFQKLQGELQNAVASRQKLEGQKQENLGVQQASAVLRYILLKQDKFEAENTVKGRLDFISSEITRQEDTIKETQEKLEKKKTEIIQIQTAAQSQGKEAPQ